MTDLLSSHQTLFHLLRLALGFPAGEAVDLSAVKKADWEALVDMAFEQGVAALSVDGLGCMVDGLDLLESEELEDLCYELFGEALSCEDDYRKHIEAIRSLVGCFSAQGLDTYALKGIAFARYYPVPEHRYSCGFDCKVRCHSDGSPACAIADRIARENGIEVDDSMNKHSRYVVSKVSVGNHRNIISVNGSRKDKRFDAYLQSLLEPKERLQPDVECMPLLVVRCPVLCGARKDSFHDGGGNNPQARAGLGGETEGSGGCLVSGAVRGGHRPLRPAEVL